jgi:serine/threonine-protein kinase
MLGPHKILAALGAGGMGEVYRAKDTTLNREVALKVLSPSLANDAAYMARFQREAQLLASLNHPNIAILYGLETSGDTRALVMELVEGPTLADRIRIAPIPQDEALPIARQIAEALAAAHERGIVHRDLKPANVKVTPEGTVKVLDFGLAKALDEEPPAPGSVNSSTLTMAATRAGVILGTAAYMPPEQAKGKRVDKRADIWAFGVVLFEMLTGKPMHSAETIPETLASVMRDEPRWQTLPTNTPPAIRRLLRRCLDKDPKRRLRDIGDAIIEIDDAQAGSEAPATPSAANFARSWLLWTAGALALALAVTAALLYRATRPVAQPLLRLSLDLGPDAWLARGTIGDGMSLSSDGKRLVFTVRAPDGRLRLATRRLDQSQITMLGGAEGAAPFFSPDGQWIGFGADGKLKKILVEGGAPVTLCEGAGPGASWGDDGNIISALGPASGLFRVPSAGGTPKPVTQLDQKKGERTHRWPQVLPGSRAVLFTSHTARGSYEDANIDVVALTTGQRKTVQTGGFCGRYLPSGHLVYIHQSTLFAAPFDLARLAVTGTPVPVLENVSNTAYMGGYFDFSKTGTLAYLSGGGESTQAIFSMDSQGKLTPLHTLAAVLWTPRFSPDGKRLALAIDNGPGASIWVLDVDRAAPTRVSFLPSTNMWPVWTPDGRHLVFRSTGSGIYWIRADGSGEPQRLTDDKLSATPSSFSPDGKRLAMVQQGTNGTYDIWTAPVEGDPDHPRLGKAEPFLEGPFAELTPQFSPDGRWLAYMSNESGAYEVFVRPSPGIGAAGGKWQISTGGGMFPMWSPTELFFRSPNGLIIAAGYTVKGDTFVPGKTRPWSEKRIPYTSIGASNAPRFDLSPDGSRLAVIQSPQEAGEQKPNTQLTFLLNFFDYLRQRVPTEGK